MAATATLVLKGSANDTGQGRLGVCGETVAIAVAWGELAAMYAAIIASESDPARAQYPGVTRCRYHAAG